MFEVDEDEDDAEKEQPVAGAACRDARGPRGQCEPSQSQRDENGDENDQRGFVLNQATRSETADAEPSAAPSSQNIIAKAMAAVTRPKA